MRSITYAGQTVITTDEVGSTLVELTAALAKNGQAEAVSIPIVVDGDASHDAELVIGLGNDVLSTPMQWMDEVPDFSERMEHLTAQLDRLRPPREPHLGLVEDDTPYDPDLDNISRA